MVAINTVSTAQSNYYVKKAQSYQREAEYYQKKAEGYRREAAYYLKKAQGYQRDVAAPRRRIRWRIFSAFMSAWKPVTSCL